MQSLFTLHRELLASVLQIMHRVIATFLFKQTGIPRTQAATGAVTLVQRFGSAANLNIHLLALVLGGCLAIRKPRTHRHTGRDHVAAHLPPSRFAQPCRATDATGQDHRADIAIADALGASYRRGGSNGVAGSFTDPDDLVVPLQAAASTYRIAHGARAGEKVLCLQLASRRAAVNNEASRALCANAHGFNLHAGVRRAADDRQGLEQLCRYFTRPAIANKRLRVNRTGQVVLKLKTAWRDGTSHRLTFDRSCVSGCIHDS